MKNKGSFLLPLILSLISCNNANYKPYEKEVKNHINKINKSERMKNTIGVTGDNYYQGFKYEIIANKLIYIDYCSETKIIDKKDYIYYGGAVYDIKTKLKAWDRNTNEYLGNYVCSEMNTTYFFQIVYTGENKTIEWADSEIAPSFIISISNCEVQKS